ncbi:MAG: enoyl-CoA hydratase/isomerase family protein [Planctomycetes bacterium]|nr:enoyl-CoA hydratase/isomerase family protein [Planctomycetota bacterium]
MANILVEQADFVRVIKVNRPDKLNALNIETLKEFLKVAQSAKEDRNTRAVVLTGAGDKAFIAGADIEEMNKMTPTEAKEFSDLGNNLVSTVENMGKVSIACINGYALGGGCELSLGCTFRFLSEKAVLGQPEVKLGIMPGFGGSQRLVRFLGKPKALELCITGRNIDAEEALILGLGNRVYSKEDLFPKTLEFAKEISQLAPIAVRYIIEAINRGSECTLREALDFESHLFSLCFATEDMRIGTTAFLKKQKPNFTGK